MMKCRHTIALAAIPAAFFALTCLGADDGIKEGVHGYTPKWYVQPKEPEVLERLEWFKDQKLALFMHWGPYSTIGLGASWALCDKESSWSRKPFVDWTDDGEKFKRQYRELYRVFNPIRFQPEKWAAIAKRDGFKYVIFTMKHHDGFCMYDTKYSDYKITAPECPFSTDPQADIAKHVFDAFRKEGFGIAAYFSKPDWYNEDYWENHGFGRVTSRNPTYNVKKNPKKWARFCEFTKNQMIEIVRDYGKIDILWLDGGQVQRRYGQDIKIEQIIAEARKYNPGLISVDRTAGGPCENVITPERKIPQSPIALPWESCITLAKRWSYFFDDEYKSVREVVHMLVDIVAKGGNLALGVGPQPDGRLPHEAIKRMDALGAWLKVNGEAIYETRPLAPYRKGDWAFTRNRRTGAEYAIRLCKEGEKASGNQTIPDVSASKIVHLATGKTLSCTAAKSGLSFDLPADFKSDSNADVFRLVK